MGKGEIARYEQFLLFPQCFQKASFPGASKGIIVWEWVNSLSKQQNVSLLKLKAFVENIFRVNDQSWWRLSVIGLKTLWEKEEMMVPAFSLFLIVSSTASPSES